MSEPLLPARHYTDPEVYAREVEHIFRREWIGVARADALAQPGDYVAFDLLGEPLVAVRGRDGRIRVLSRVCRHRWMPLVDEGEGRCNAFQCPYHLWSYDLEGRLVGAPQMQGVAGFRKRDVRLPEVRAEVWQGFLFVSLDPGAEPLAPRLAGLDRVLAPYRMDAMRRVAHLDYEASWNWKVAVENGIESYHHLGPHRDTLEPVFPTSRTQVGPQAGPYVVYRNPTPDDAPLPTLFEPVPGLGPAERSSLLIVTVFPFHLFALTPDTLSWLQLLPALPEQGGVERHRVRWVVAVPEAAAAAPDLEAKVAEQRAILDAVHRQDMAVCAGVQRGLRSRLAHPSRLSPLEDTVLHFQRWVRDRLDETAARAGARATLAREPAAG